MKAYFVFILIFATTFVVPLSAQGDLEEQAIKELRKQGVDQSEVEKRLLERGYDPYEIDPDNPTELLEIQRVTEEIIAEIKSEQLAVKELVEEKSSEVESTTSAVETLVSNPVDSVKETVSVTKAEPIKAENLIFGHQIYAEGAIRYYKENEFINPPSDYILGPGDKVTVSIWGQAEENFSQEISDGGYVKFSRIPRITLAGLRLDKAKELMKTKMARYYPFRDEDFELKVTSTRNINIFITGEVLNVGSYNISAVNPAVNALAAAGGPSQIGSVRDIRVVSSTGSRNLDLYKFLRDPQLSKGLFLNEGDYIFVPLVGKVVSINGAVKRPYKYELLPNENLADLIDFAGGFTVDALKKNINVTRYENDERVLINLDASNPSSLRNFELLDGDVIDILSIDNEIENTVSVVGALSNPGTFELKKGMRISDLMDIVDLDQDAILDIVYVVRLNDDQKTVRWEVINIAEALDSKNSAENIELRAFDKITIRGKSQFARNNNFSVRGAVNFENDYQLDESDNLRVSDAIFLAGGLRPIATDFGYIIRSVPGSTSPEYVPINAKEILADESSPSNITIEPNDIIQIYSKEDYFDETFVTVDGAVRQPNSYRYNESLTLRDVLILSKGLRMSAATNSIDVFRLEFNDNNKTRTLVAKATVDADLNISNSDNFVLQPFDHIVVRQAPEYEIKREVYISGEVRYPGKYYILDDNYTVASLVEQAGGPTQEAFLSGATLNRLEEGLGYVIIDLEKAIKNPSSPDNVILQLGDNVQIPKIRNLVTVSGAINTSDVLSNAGSSGSKVNFVHDGNTSLKYYVDRAGGFMKKSNKSTVAVIYPNGEVKRAKRFLFFRNYPKVVPGSRIVVDTKEVKVDREGNRTEKVDWGEVFSDSLKQATAIISLLLLVDRLD